MFDNLKLIIFSLVGTITALYVFNKYFASLFSKFIKNITNFLAERLEYKFSIILLELIFFLITIFVFRLMLTDLGIKKYLILLFYSFLVSISMLTIRKIKVNNPNIIGIIYYMEQQINMENYFINRLICFVIQLGQSFYILSFITIIGMYIYSMSWPIIVYFIGFIIVPLSAVYWTYYPYIYKVGTNKNFVNKDIKAVNIRKVIIYIMLFVYALLKAYDIFQIGVGIENVIISQETDIIMTIISIVFFAFERLINLITKDYRDFKK